MYSSSANQTFSGSITGAGGLQKDTSASSTLTLSGTSAYTGATNVNAGTLKITGTIYCGTCLGGSGVASTASAITTVNTGGTLEVTNWGWVGSLGDRYYDAVGLVINGGTLRYSGPNTSAANSSTRGFTVGTSGATFESATAGTTWSLLDGASSNSSYKSVFNGNVTFQGLGDFNVSHIISGANTLTKSGAGTLTLSGLNTYTGTTTINAGTLAFASTGKIYYNSGSSMVTATATVNSGAVLDLQSWDWAGSLGYLNFDATCLVINGGTVRQSGSTANSGAGINMSSRQFTIQTGGATFDSATAGITWTMDRDSRSNYQVATAGNVTFTGAGNTVFNTWLSGAYSVTKNGTGTVTMSGSNTYTGGTNFNAGTVNVNGSTALGPSGTLGFGGGTLQYSANNITDYSGRASNAASQAYKIDTNGRDLTWASALTSSGGTLTKLGTGTLTLTGTNTFTGDTTISAGTLQLGSGGGTGSLASTNIVDNGTLAFYTNVDTTGAYNISGTGGVQVTGVTRGSALYSSYLTTTPVTIATNSTVAEVLYRLSGARESGTAVTGTPQAGIYLKTFNPLTNTANAQVQMYDGTYTKFVYVKLIQNGTNVQVVVDTSNNTGTGAGYKTGNYLGTDMTVGASSMGLATGSNGASGYGVDTLYTTGKVTLTGTNTFTGGVTLSNTTTTVSSGAPQYSQTALGTLEVGSLASNTVSNSGLLIFNTSAAQTWAGAMSGSGYFIKEGSSALALTGDSAYTGAAMVYDGSLQLGNGGTTGAFGAGTNYLLLSANANLTVNRSNALTLSGLVQGLGSLTKEGTGTLTLSGDNNYAGLTNVNAGALTVAHSNALGSAAAGTTVANGAALQFSGGVSTADNLTVQGTGMGGTGAR